MEAQLEALGTGELFGLWFQSLFVGLTMNALSICKMCIRDRVYKKRSAVMVAPDKKTLKKSVKSMFFMVQTRCEVETIKY